MLRFCVGAGLAIEHDHQFLNSLLKPAQESDQRVSASPAAVDTMVSAHA
jgi:hypothetical protein